VRWSQVIRKSCGADLRSDRAETARLRSSPARTQPPDIDHTWQFHASYAPPGLVASAMFATHGSRHGLNSYASPGLVAPLRFFSHGLLRGLKSYAPPGLVAPLRFFSHGSRRGLRSYAPPGLGRVPSGASPESKIAMDAYNSAETGPQVPDVTPVSRGALCRAQCVYAIAAHTRPARKLWGRVRVLWHS
jgi:hypothetical protein